MAMLRPPIQLPLAQSVRHVPTSRPREEWAYEPKFDGWRALLFTTAGVVQSRRETDLADRFPEIVESGSRLGDALLDGENVALKEGRLDFGALTSNPRTRAAAGISVYFVALDLLAEKHPTIARSRLAIAGSR